MAMQLLQNMGQISRARQELVEKGASYVVTLPVIKTAALEPIAGLSLLSSR